MGRKNTFAFGDWFKMCETGFMAGDLAWYSAEVIKHRSRMIADALAGKTPLMQAEFFDMWQEKIVASQVAAAHFQKQLVNRTRNPLSLQGMTMSSIGMWASLMKPYHTKTVSNARRLRKRS